MFKNTISSITDTDLYQFSDTYDSINTFTGGAKRVVQDNASVLIILSLIAVLYMVVNNKNTSNEMINTIDNPAVKLGIMGLIIYISKDNPLISLVAIVIFCLTIQSLQAKKAPVIVDVEEDKDQEPVQLEEHDELDEIIDNELDNDTNLNGGINATNLDNIMGADLDDNIGSSLNINDNSVQVQSDSQLQNNLDNSSDLINNFNENDLLNGVESGVESGIDQQMNSVSNMMTNQFGDINNSELVDGARNMANSVQRMGQDIISPPDNNLSQQDPLDGIEGFGISDLDNYEKLN